MPCCHHAVAGEIIQLALNNNTHTLMSSKDTKEIIQGRKCRKDRQYNDQKIWDKGTNNYLQNTTHKTND